VARIFSSLSDSRLLLISCLLRLATGEMDGFGFSGPPCRKTFGTFCVWVGFCSFLNFILILILFFSSPPVVLAAVRCSLILFSVLLLQFLLLLSSS